MNNPVVSSISKLREDLKNGLISSTTINLLELAPISKEDLEWLSISLFVSED
jgi:branched-subunit amino acid permease